MGEGGLVRRKGAARSRDGAFHVGTGPFGCATVQAVIQGIEVIKDCGIFGVGPFAADEVLHADEFGFSSHRSDPSDLA